MSQDNYFTTEDFCRTFRQKICLMGPTLKVDIFSVVTSRWTTAHRILTYHAICDEIYTGDQFLNLRRGQKRRKFFVVITTIYDESMTNLALKIRCKNPSLL